MNPGDSGGLSLALVSLLRGAVVREESESRWQTLMEVEPQVRDYVRVLGLDLVLVEDEGYAFLRQRDAENELEIPRLIRRRPLSYPVSLLLALLRRKLVEQESSSGEARLILDVAEIVDELHTFLPAGRTEARTTDQVSAYLRRVADLGFIRFLKNDPRRFEVKRLLKAFATAQWLQEMEQRLASEGAEGPEEGEEVEHDDATS